MLKQPDITISLIIPVYKVSAYVERCLKSVIKQTYNHFECIIVDDASPDDSIARCERMIAAYEGPIQFRILRHEQNRGLSAARNTGTDAATGDYILYIDSDDLISNDCVERLMAPVLRDKSIEMVFGDCLRFNDDGVLDNHRDSWRQYKDYASKDAVRDFFFSKTMSFPSSACNRLISREFIKRYDLRFKEGQIWEEILWTFFAIKHFRHVVSIPGVTYYYYQRPDSICHAMKEEELRKRRCAVFDIISNNLTPGEEGREAAHFSWMFNFSYIRIPKSKEFNATAKRLAKALPFRRYPAEKTLLTSARLLPHNHTGKEIFKFLDKHLASVSH